MNIEQKLEEIIHYNLKFFDSDEERMQAEKELAQAILTSPDIAVVERGKWKRISEILWEVSEDNCMCDSNFCERTCSAAVETQTLLADLEG